MNEFFNFYEIIKISVTCDILFLEEFWEEILEEVWKKTKLIDRSLWKQTG